MRAQLTSIRAARSRGWRHAWANSPTSRSRCAVCARARSTSRSPAGALRRALLWHYGRHVAFALCVAVGAPIRARALVRRSSPRSPRRCGCQRSIPPQPLRSRTFGIVRCRACVVLSIPMAIIQTNEYTRRQYPVPEHAPRVTCATRRSTSSAQCERRLPPPRARRRAPGAPRSPARRRRLPVDRDLFEALAAVAEAREPALKQRDGHLARGRRPDRAGGAGSAPAPGEARRAACPSGAARGVSPLEAGASAASVASRA